MKIVTTLLALFLLFPFSDQTAPAPAPAADVADLAWLAGAWTGTDRGTEVEEVWLAPKGGAMLGLHRDVADGKMVAFEFLRIASRNGTIAYIASPNGMTPTVFPLKESGENRVTFENPKHDYPQRILYWLEKDGALHARIEGDRDGKKPAMEWTWRKQAEAAASRPK